MSESPNEHSRLAVFRGLREHLQEVVLGQDEAVAGLSDALLAGEMGHTLPGRPRSLQLILGPTGTGKTKAVIAASSHLYGTAAIARVNCAEFSSDERVPLLLGTAAGERGLLGLQVSRLRSAGGRILLLDEIEKAHPQVCDYLLGIEEAAVTLANGETLDLSDLHVIATSNVGSQGIVGDAEGVARSSVRRFVEQEAASHFRPEVLARFYAPSILVFSHLSRGCPGEDLHTDDRGGDCVPVRRALVQVWASPPNTGGPGRVQAPRERGMAPQAGRTAHAKRGRAPRPRGVG